MRIGLFLDENQEIDSLSDFLLGFGSEVVGYSSKRPHNRLSGKYLFQPYPMELLAGCDVAIVYSTGLFINDIPREAIRRGIHLYLADLPSYGRAILSDLLCLMQEIDVSVEFGYSGFSLIELLPNQAALNGQVFLECRREMLSGTAKNQFQRVLAFDLATLLRCNAGLIKKIRVVSIPPTSQDFRLINVRLEYANGSVFCYTLNCLGENESFDLNFFGNSSSDKYHLSWQGVTFSNQICSHTINPLAFVKTITSRDKPKFSIDKALELDKLIQEILDRLAMNM